MTPTDPTPQDVASIVMAAGRGSRMQGYAGNKTLLPLVAGETPFCGSRPILLHLLAHLPTGPKVLIVNHCKADVIAATRGLPVAYCEQPLLNGTGGAILAALPQIARLPCRRFIITMGDVPFVRSETYARLVQALDANDLVVLGFRPADRKQYGVLEIEAGRVQRITEWKYWKDYPAERAAALAICNSGIYAATREALLAYLPVLASRPQTVHKLVDGRMTAIEEFFITDLIEFLVADGRPVGYQVAEDEAETMGIDDLGALEKAQARVRAAR
ncbi:MAG: NTP transferase domain-containing protein [Desulfobacteraceae bacterium]|jgi:bifunctional UDP-N-acetylglucosamine pyrophosphorylase/glucosamine-1-phosphate N-acetyltransferase